MLCNATPLGIWGLMSAKAIFKCKNDSSMINVPSVLQVTTLGTWGLMHDIQKVFPLKPDKNTSLDWVKQIMKLSTGSFLMN